MPEFRDKFRIDAEAVQETAAAILVRTDHGDEWIPKSQIDDDSEVSEKGDVGTLVVNQWIAQQKGWA